MGLYFTCLPVGVYLPIDVTQGHPPSPITLLLHSVRPSGLLNVWVPGLWTETGLLLGFLQDREGK